MFFGLDPKDYLDLIIFTMIVPYEGYSTNASRALNKYLRFSLTIQNFIDNSKSHTVDIIGKPIRVKKGCKDEHTS